MILRDKGKTFTPAPEGLHQAVCVDFVDLGVMDTPWGEKAQCEVRWQIDEVLPTSGARFLVVKRYTASLNEKATLRHHLESWRGRKFTAEELKGFDTEQLVGVNCMVQIMHVQGTKNPEATFAVVQAVVPMVKGMTKLVPEDYVRVKDRPAESPNGTPDESDVPF